MSAAEAALRARIAALEAALRETMACLRDVAEGKGGWAWEEVLDTAQEALDGAPFPGLQAVDALSLLGERGGVLDNATLDLLAAILADGRAADAVPEVVPDPATIVVGTVRDAPDEFFAALLPGLWPSGRGEEIGTVAGTLNDLRARLLDLPAAYPDPTSVVLLGCAGQTAIALVEEPELAPGVLAVIADAAADPAPILAALRRLHLDVKASP